MTDGVGVFEQDRFAKDLLVSVQPGAIFEVGFLLPNG